MILVCHSSRPLLFGVGGPRFWLDGEYRSRVHWLMPIADHSLSNIDPFADFCFSRNRGGTHLWQLQTMWPLIIYVQKGSAKRRYAKKDADDWNTGAIKCGRRRGPGILPYAWASTLIKHPGALGGVFEVVFHVLRNAENAYGVRFLQDRMHERSAALLARLMIPAVSSHIRSEGARLREWFLRAEGNSPSKHITPMLNMFIVSFIA